MGIEEALGDLLIHLERTTGLPPVQAQRAVQEVLTYFSESVEEFVRRRHGELRREHLRNEQIFDRICAELPFRRFTGSELSRRQIRRVVYG